jgi:ThiD2 family
MLIDKSSAYRILDANCNRLREGLRLIEEYYRFVENNETLTIAFKSLRHKLKNVEQLLGRENLLLNRDTSTDCFSKDNRPEELTRDGIDDIVNAGFKRAQEASRVIEEYAKIIDSPDVSSIAKLIRFELYTFEKDLWIYNHGKKKAGN